MQDLGANFPVDEEPVDEEPADEEPAGEVATPATGAGSPRRRRRIAMFAAVAVALMLPPPLAYVAFGRDPDQSGQVAIGGQPIADDGYGANAPDQDEPLNAPGQPASGATQQPWQAVDLAAATLTLGAWRPSPAGSRPCPTGKVTFAGSTATIPGKATVRLRQNALVDVDQDGTNEVALVLFCQDSPAGTYQAIVLKSAPGGSPTTLGQLARSGPSGEDILAVAPRSGGLIDLTVGSIIPCCGTPRSLELTQVRTFAWQRSGFTQVAGPATFVADRAAVGLDISAPAVHLSGLVNGKSSGTLTVTVHNRGPVDARRVSVVVWPEQPLARGPGGDWARCVSLDGTSRSMVCPIGDLPVDETGALTLPLTGLFGSQAITLEARIGDQAYGTVRVTSYYG